MPLFELYKPSESLDRAAVLEELAAIPTYLAAAIAGVSAAQLAAHPSPDAWSAFQTLCHMRDAAIVYSARFRWIVFDDDPFLPNYDENNWVATSRDTPADAALIVSEFAASRSDLMRVLTRLPEAAWQRTGRHEVLGTLVLEPYVRHQLAHEQQHLEQLEAALSPKS